MPVTKVGDKVEVTITDEDLKQKSAVFFRNTYQTIAGVEIETPYKEKHQVRLAELLANVIDYRSDTLKDFINKELEKPDGFMKMLEDQITEAGSVRFSGNPTMGKLKEHLLELKTALIATKKRIDEVEVGSSGNQSATDLTGATPSYVALSALMHIGDSGQRRG